ncbi:hypothetical protein BK131_04570 [Paenibacillus amylolyticus]|uniref:HK97 gp10 family phage protein n=1 Tax=Paenibacillus amylolyticus TaxID=1451 RepID=A0A1R1C544_PAEAM|nr:HK97 gp10 family phage protein [Paenibacillus amylolyticus]OMF17243.1 hypothetical protein BK131_04570 [Paenibacillus amylolyticus]
MARLGRFDYSELEQLSQSVQTALNSNVIDQFIRDFLLEMAYRADRKIKMRTPVDTGDLRRRWVVGEVKRVGDTYMIEISNNLDYASYVENGHRTGKDLTGWVEGRFMAKISMKEIERQLPAYLQRKQTELIEKIFSGWS